MNYFDDAKNVASYIEASKGVSGKNLIDELNQHLAKNSTLLELGMGPGKDLDLLSQHYRVTGSDYSEHFIEAYRLRNPKAELLKLDASQPKVDKLFDAIYSNKVLHQFSAEQLAQSFEHQAQALNDSGLIMHSFWLGSGSEEFSGDTAYYYQIKDIEALLKPWFNLVASASYAEFEDGDSFWVIARKC